MSAYRRFDCIILYLVNKLTLKRSHSCLLANNTSDRRYGLQVQRRHPVKLYAKQQQSRCETYNLKLHNPTPKKCKTPYHTSVCQARLKPTMPKIFGVINRQHMVCEMLAGVDVAVIGRFQLQSNFSTYFAQCFSFSPVQDCDKVYREIHRKQKTTLHTF